MAKYKLPEIPQRTVHPNSMQAKALKSQYAELRNLNDGLSDTTGDVNQLNKQATEIAELVTTLAQGNPCKDIALPNLLGKLPEEPVRGLRFNSGKTLYNLIPPYPLEQIAKVFTKGAEKYAPHNWKKGMPWSEVEGSLIRHLEAYRSGEDFDSESGLYHLAHVAVNAIFLIDYYRSNPQFDDRIKSYLNLPRIVLDIDEVVCGWAEGYSKHTGKEIQSQFWDSRYGFGPELDELAKDKGFWINLPCIRKPDFVPHAYVSSRSIPVEWTQEWLEKNKLPCRPVYHVPFNTSKVDVLKSIDTEYFIDDRFENFAEAMKAGICAFLMDASHNQFYNVGYRRIKDLSLRNIIR